MADSEREETQIQVQANDEQLRRLAQEHAKYEQRLDGLLNKKNISGEEMLEEVRLKKLKLRLKDEMRALEQRHRSIAVA